MGKTDPRWKDANLPEKCPECGEGTDLAAVGEVGDVEIVNVDEVFCGSCGYEWAEYPADSDTTPDTEP